MSIKYWQYTGPLPATMEVDELGVWVWREDHELELDSVTAEYNLELVKLRKELAARDAQIKEMVEALQAAYDNRAGWLDTIEATLKAAGIDVEGE